MKLGLRRLALTTEHLQWGWSSQVHVGSQPPQKGAKGGTNALRPQSIQVLSLQCSGKGKKKSCFLTLCEISIMLAQEGKRKGKVTLLITPKCLPLALVFKQKHLEIPADRAEGGQLTKVVNPKCFAVFSRIFSGITMAIFHV